ncbi:SIMPL domain-containing protein [Pedobacter glucosidilyticus]|uniref:SIMPL domain-containing protein n=1 Tax=Pedobacter glucosidilyticus TaxID=1122941 RepID=UPI001FE03955|nr:SIMPL domain-containing protein [Pedobacter glucosidilyticus]
MNEADNKNKKSTEELEKILERTLKELNINTEKDLSLLDYNSDFKNYFLKSQDILKVKNYSLLVRDAVTAGKVFKSLEDVGISNVNIEKTEYSKSESLLLELKYLTIKKAKINALKMLEPLNQKLGKAIFITDNNSISNTLQGKVSGIQIRGASSLYGSKASEPILVEFQKIKFQSQVNVKFIIE